MVKGASTSRCPSHDHSPWREKEVRFHQVPCWYSRARAWDGHWEGHALQEMRESFQRGNEGGYSKINKRAVITHRAQNEKSWRRQRSEPTGPDGTNLKVWRAESKRCLWRRTKLIIKFISIRQVKKGGFPDFLDFKQRLHRLAEELSTHLISDLERHFGSLTPQLPTEGQDSARSQP